MYCSDIYEHTVWWNKVSSENEALKENVNLKLYFKIKHRQNIGPAAAVLPTASLSRISVFSCNVTTLPIQWGAV
jgi:hypothetical protein